MSAADDAALAAALFAVDPAGMGGVCLRSLVHPARDQWLALLRSLLPAAAPLRRIPCTIAEDRLLGGLDLTATLKAGRPIAQPGVLAESHGGVVVVAMAERLDARTAALLNAVLDRGEISLPRDGVTIAHAASIGIVALDESMADEEGIPASLLDRLAFPLDLSALSLRAVLMPTYDARDVLDARGLLAGVRAGADVQEALCATAQALGAGSTRVSLLALAAARAAAALEGRTLVTEADAVLAGRLVLAPRASIAPAAEAPKAEDAPQDDPADAPPTTPPPPADSAQTERQSLEITDRDLENLVIAASTAAIPAGLLSRLRSASPRGAGRAGAAGRAGVLRQSAGRGRPAGLRQGAPQRGARLNVVATLRAAAPWQRLRGLEASAGGARGVASGTRAARGVVRGGGRIRIEAADFRSTRFKLRSRTVTIFVVDASGSAALNRLAEAKGAVELLLADCYIRRDQVAVIGFRGRTAELLLPPTRSLVRAKRSLASLPGGGGTPLATAIDSAVMLALKAQRRGETPTLVLLTDGRANVARDGAGGRELAQRQALAAARAVSEAGVAALFVDTSPRPSALAKDLAAAMTATYVALPYADARSLSGIVKAAQAGGAAR